MSKGKGKTISLNSQGMVVYQTVPSWDFLYDVSTVKDSRFNIGDEVIAPGRRKFVYAKSSGACETGQGCKFTYSGYTSYTALGVSASKGDHEITVPAATHAALTEDELRGGFVVIFNDADSTGMIRGIIGNDAAAANAAFDIQLDGGLSANIVAATAAIETYQNSYAALQTDNDSAAPIAGVPAAYVSAASKYFWVQVEGPIWCAPQTSNVGENGGIGCFWRHDGSLEGAEVALGGLTVPAGDSSQYAGYVIQGSQAGNGPLFMLKC